ncbi:FAD-dependent oxidoreductase [Paraburkholderia dipogonis]|uniref:FAD-dependent oxidoreductase n=1 Tax=Paraburkholderia dipogonis TaxID=1211383 RepID=A0ABW9AL88_9BURK
MQNAERWASRASAAPASTHRLASHSIEAFDAIFDVIVVGAGGGGFPTALFSRWLGNSVALVEKDRTVGGTAKKAAFWYWVPNNRPMREAGIEDRKEDCLRYMARLARPENYDPEDANLGLDAWEYEAFSAIYDSASPAAELLHARGALEYRHLPGVTDYWAELPENTAPQGRVLIPAGACESMSDGGKVAIQSMHAAAQRDGVDVRTGLRVQRVILNEAEEVVGIEATDVEGNDVRLGARKAVIFATGGFTHNNDLRKNFLHAPLFGGCAARSNEGDFIHIASPLRAQLRNMNYAWMCPVSLDRLVAGRDDFTGTFSVGGDSMLWVNKQGKRVVNEKLAYNELAQKFFEWDAQLAEYPNLVLVAIWDQRSQDHSASTEYGCLIRPDAAQEGHLISGNTLEELADALARRLETFERLTGQLCLADDFLVNLRDTIQRFNRFAREGVDTDFRRGDRLVEKMFNGAVQNESASPNPTMFPLADSGPYYAALVTGGTLDTKGGPLTNSDGQVLNDSGAPIPGLYGVGNCVASASARAYWAGGGTLGPILAFAYRAANTAHLEPNKALLTEATQA